MPFTLSGSTITQANEATNSILSVADGGSNTLILEVTAHGYSAGDLVQATSTTSYNGVYLTDSIVDADHIKIPDTTVYEVQNLWGVTETGSVARGDKDLSPLSGIAGVTTSSSAGITVYHMGALKLRFVGAQLMDAMTERAVTTSTSIDAFRFRPNSHVTINGFIEELGHREYYDNKVLVATKQASLYVDASSDLYMRGGWIESGYVRMAEAQNNGVRWNIERGTFGSFDITASDPQFRMFTANMNITGLLRLVKLQYVPRVPLNYPVSGLQVEFFSAMVASASYPNVEIPFSNFSGTPGFPICRLWGGNKYRFNNPVTGTDNLVVPHVIGNGTSTGTALAYKYIQPTVKDSDGVGIQDALMFIRDTDNGNRTDGNGYTFTNDFTYQEASDSLGIFAETPVLVGVVNEPSYDATPEWDYRSKNGTNDDKFDIHFWNYGKKYTVSEQVLNGKNALIFDWVMFDDELITEPDKAVVDAYTSLDSATETYDATVFWKTDPSFTNLESPSISTLPLTRSGITIDAGAYDVVIDTSAVDVFDFTDPTITIKSTLFTGGIKSSKPSPETTWDDAQNWDDTEVWGGMFT